MKINVYYKQLESQLLCSIAGLILFALWLCFHSLEEYSVTVPLQLHAVRKFIAVLKTCFALLSSLLTKTKLTKGKKALGSKGSSAVFSVTSKLIFLQYPHPFHSSPALDSWLFHTIIFTMEDKCFYLCAMCSVFLTVPGIGPQPIIINFMFH